MRTLLLVAFPLVLASVALTQDRPPASAAKDVLGVGWRWELPPTPLRDGPTREGSKAPKDWIQYGQTAFVPSGHVSLVQTAAGNPVLTHLFTPDPKVRGTAVPEYKPVLLLADGKPVWPDMAMGAQKNALAEQRYVFPVPQDAAQIVSFAFGVLDLEGKRERAVVGAARAKELGASVLPLPIVGEPLDFDLPTMDGGRFRAKDQLGKVVVIDSWATW